MALGFLRHNVLFFVVLTSCASVGSRNFDDGSPLYRHAQTFDAYVQGRLDANQVQSLIRSCRAGHAENPFCHSVRRAKSVFRHQARKERVLTPPPKRAPTPSRIRFSSKGELLDVWTLRRQPIESLLAALHELDRAQLERIAGTAVRQKCPNRLAVATAATLEDHLPDTTLLPTIAALYHRGASCAKRRSADREHFTTRAGLLYWWAGRYRDAEREFSSATPTDAFEGRTLYWKYRAHTQLGETDKAAKAVERLFTHHPFSFHAMVASMETKTDLAARLVSGSPSTLTRSKRSAGVNPIVEQAEILKRYGFEKTAAVLAQWGLESYRRTEPELRVHLASLGDAHTRVETLPLLLLRHSRLRTIETFRLSYPLAFFDLIKSHRNGTDPYLLLSLARKESKFDPNAVSMAGARGLLQINPTTGERLTGGRAVDLIDVETNVKLGSRYFRSLMSRYNGKPFLALAAYNAGEAATDKWRKRYPSDDPMLFIDLISYRETRNYVGYVLNNYYWYRRLYEEDSQSSVRKHIALDR